QQQLKQQQKRQRQQQQQQQQQQQDQQQQRQEEHADKGHRVHEKLQDDQELEDNTPSRQAGSGRRRIVDESLSPGAGHTSQEEQLGEEGIEARLLGILEGQATPTSDEAEAATAAMQAFKARKKGQEQMTNLQGRCAMI
ncbi:hypothetical protein DUNSADRAFT_16260, partial [Dunaliella salina]